jgi:hypothetical protein
MTVVGFHGLAAHRKRVSAVATTAVATVVATAVATAGVVAGVD